MSEQNPYQAPESQLITPVSGHLGGNVTSALAGDYSFSIGQLIAFGWDKIEGFKGVFWIALFIYMIASSMLNMITEFVGNSLPLPSVAADIVKFGLSFLAGSVAYSLMVGLTFISIHRAADQPVSVNDIFKYLPQLVPIALTYLLMMLLVIIGFCLLVLPGIYLMVAYAYALPLLIEKKLTPWQALEMSRQAIHLHWWKVFGFLTLVGLLAMLSFLFFFIPAIWVLPATSVAMGRLYIVIFGLDIDGNTGDLPPEKTATLEV